MLDTVRAGLALHRVHWIGREATEYNPIAASNPYAGGRFDSPTGDYSYLYAGSSQQCAVAETFLRDTPLDELVAGTPRSIQDQTLEERALTRLHIARDLAVVRLVGPGLHAVGQPDGWLTTCDSLEYAHTRAWAVRIRQWVPGAVGFAWRARHDNDQIAYVFFGDRMTGDALQAQQRCNLRTKTGHKLVQRSLAPYGTSIA